MQDRGERRGGGVAGRRRCRELGDGKWREQGAEKRAPGNYLGEKEWVGEKEEID